MTAKPSMADVNFKDRFEAGEVGPSEFHHRDHLKLVYVYLCESSVKTANDRMRRSLTKFLKDNNVPASKYHETLTMKLPTLPDSLFYNELTSQEKFNEPTSRARYSAQDPHS